jgi:glycosyltransferase involved in cell wall biosynthesis
MKVLRIIARLNVGGPARHVVWLTAGLKAMGCESLLVTGVVPPGEDDMGHIAAAAEVTPLTLPQMSREISPKDVVTVWKLYRLMLRERPDIVHTHTAKAGAVGRVAGLMYRWLRPAALVGKPRACKLVHTYHGHVFYGYYSPLKTKLFLAIERVLARLATDRIIVVSEQQRREISEHFRVGRPEQFAVIPLGAELDAFANWHQRRARLRNELGVNDDDLLIGIVGRLTGVKNHDLFLQAAAHVKEIRTAEAEQQRVRFLIIGDGKLRTHLEARAKELGLGDEVLFLGTRNDPEFFYPALDIVSLTSRNEGTPLTLIEAMANARPVIATAVGGVVDLLGPPVDDERDSYQICSRGVWVRSGDARGFAAGLQRLISDEGLRRRLGHEGHEFVVQNFAKERLLNDMAKLYAELVSPRSSKAMGEEMPDRGVVSH